MEKITQPSIILNFISLFMLFASFLAKEEVNSCSSDHWKDHGQKSVRITQSNPNRFLLHFYNIWRLFLIQYQNRFNSSNNIQRWLTCYYHPWFKFCAHQLRRPNCCFESIIHTFAFLKTKSASSHFIYITCNVLRGFH